MARCEDWPCCGHEAGCCPDRDEGGNQLNMKCVCGATLPLHSRYSICDSCMNAMEEDEEPGGRFDYERDEDMDGDDDYGGPEDIDDFATED